MARWWGGGGVDEGGGLWGDVRVIFCVIFECVVVTVGGVVGLLVFSCGVRRLPGWEGAPVIRSIWERRGGVEKALNQLAPVFLVRGFVNPISQGAKSVNLDCGYILEKETKVLDFIVCGGVWTEVRKGGAMYCTR